ncbi:hypothetical protein AMECASPLE_002739 [Ameca splendens]|uniref:Uncharacterized protein n=1 Tax=Ameca splendens TaxID=208324 RepID=A0ABV1A782_9TELE
MVNESKNMYIPEDTLENHQDQYAHEGKNKEEREMIKRFFVDWLGACGDVTRAGGATLLVCCHVNQKRGGNLMKRWKGKRKKMKSTHRT